MKERLCVNGYDVCIVAEYHTILADGFWVYSESAGGPYASVGDLNKDMPRLVENIPAGWQLHIEFKEDLSTLYM